MLWNHEANVCPSRGSRDKKQLKPIEYCSDISLFWAAFEREYRGVSFQVLHVL